MIDQLEKDTLLGGYRVLDLSDEIGQYCAKILGDYGADVIKIEPPGGDLARNIGPFYKDIIHPEKSLYWFALNTSKRGITLNLETVAGREIIKKLAKTADFIIESFKPGYLDGLGLGYSAIEKINPKVIMTSITPFGQTGPYANYKASDIVIWALSGYMYVCGELESGEPYRISLRQTNFVGSLHAAMGTMIAHYYREVRDEGQYLDVSIQQAMTGFLMNAEETWDIYKVNIKGGGPNWLTPRPQPLGPLRIRLHWPCKDGYINFMIGGGGIQQMVNSTRALVEIADKEGLAGRLKKYDWTKYDTTRIIQEEMDQLEADFLAFFKTKTKEELYQAAVEKGIVCCPLNTVEEVYNSPQLAAREYFIKLNHPELGESITYPGAPVKMSEAQYRINRRAPLIGEHNQEIYQGELGFSAEDVARLKGASII